MSAPGSFRPGQAIADTTGTGGATQLARPRPRIAVIGIGNDMRHDDGAGPLATRRVADSCAPAIPVGPLSEPLDLLGRWDGADLAVVADAVCSGAAPGRITLDWLGSAPEVDGPGPSTPELGGSGPESEGLLTLTSRQPRSTHGLGVPDVYRLSCALGLAPRRVALVGIEGQDFSNGEGLTSQVEAGVSAAAALIAEIVHNEARYEDRLPYEA